MDRRILYHHIIRYIVISSILLGFYLLINYLGFSLQMSTTAWLSLSLNLSLIWTAFAAHQTTLFHSIEQLGWPAKRALRAPYLLSLVVLLSFFLGTYLQQESSKHLLKINCYASKPYLELCAHQNSSLEQNLEYCQSIQSFSTQHLCASLTHGHSFTSIAPIRSHFDNRPPQSLEAIKIEYTHKPYMVMFIKLLMRLALLHCLIWMMIKASLLQVISLVMIGLTICIELILSFF